MKIMEKIGNLLHSESKKWNTLKKGDKLYLLIPELKDNIISYSYRFVKDYINLLTKHSIKSQL